MKVESVSISALVEDPANARKHAPKNLEAIKGSLARFGQQKPIVVGKNNVVIAGNGTLQAARALGWETLDVHRSGLTGTDATAFALADNRSGELAEWDAEILGKTLESLKAMDFDLGSIGFDDADLAAMIASEVPSEGLTDPDEVPEVVEPRTRLGDLWVLGKHRVLCGDSTNVLDVERVMGGEKADMVFTDPPYGVSYEKKCNEIANQSKSRVTSKIAADDMSVADLKDVIQAAFNNLNVVLADKSCYYICSPQGGELGLMMMMQEANIPCRHMIIWVKNAPVFSMGRLDYDYQHEPILFGWSPNRTHHKSSKEGQWKSSAWSCSREPNKLHPTMKPVDLMFNAITNSCPKAGRVIDLFLGSGSTLIACEKTGRRCFGMEIDPHYVDVIVARWENFTGQTATLIAAESERDA